MEKIQENICKQACSYVFVQENYTKAHVLMYFLHLVLTFTPHYIIMVKGLLATYMYTMYRDVLLASVTTGLRMHARSFVATCTCAYIKLAYYSSAQEPGERASD